MLIIWVLSISFRLVSSCDCGLKPSTRIVGGQETDPNEYPWLVLFREKGGEQFCGGSLIDPDWVLTAAHCFIGRRRRRIQVVLGEHNQVDDDEISQEFDIEKIIRHPQFNMFTFNNDIALVKLKGTATLSAEISLICLPFDEPDLIMDGDTVFLAGWGLDELFGDNPDVLNDVELTYMSTGTCQSYSFIYYFAVTSNMVCASGDYQGVCRGDSGGPLMKANGNDEHFAVGLVSWALGCGETGNPAVFTKIENYLDWIEQTTGATFCKV